MEEGAGVLKVIVSKGKSLAIRDFTSSDPYVVVKLGKQVVSIFVVLVYCEEKQCVNSLSCLAVGLTHIRITR